VKGCHCGEPRYRWSAGRLALEEPGCSVGMPASGSSSRRRRAIYPGRAGGACHASHVGHHLSLGPGQDQRARPPRTTARSTGEVASSSTSTFFRDHSGVIRIPRRNSPSDWTLVPCLRSQLHWHRCLPAQGRSESTSPGTTGSSRQTGAHGCQD
jgi:hypothetical protein